MKKFVLSLKEKNNTTLISYFQIARKY